MLLYLWPVGCHSITSNPVNSHSSHCDAHLSNDIKSGWTFEPSLYSNDTLSILLSLPLLPMPVVVARSHLQTAAVLGWVLIPRTGITRPAPQLLSSFTHPPSSPSRKRPPIHLPKSLHYSLQYCGQEFKQNPLAVSRSGWLWSWVQCSSCLHLCNKHCVCCGGGRWTFRVPTVTWGVGTAQKPTRPGSGPRGALEMMIWPSPGALSGPVPGNNGRPLHG